MTKEEIIAMAREAGLAKYGNGLQEGSYPFIESIERFAALVAAAASASEREACAKVCETLLGATATDFYGKPYAAAIRARGRQ